MGLRQTQNFFVNRLLTNLDLAVPCKKSKRFFVDFAARCTRAPEGLHLRSERKQPIWNIDVMERLFAKAVASDEDFFCCRIPYSQGEHAVEVFNTRVAPLLISRQNYFRI